REISPYMGRETRGIYVALQALLTDNREKIKSGMTDEKF
ncbi:unnamed protein product, partial [Rotaria magnacalcarata]